MEKFEKFEQKEKEILELKAEIERLKKELFEKERLIERLKQDLIHDDLTQLFTRKFFQEFLKKELEKREPEKNCLLFCDIDDFKKINDNFGHQKGDEVLKRVAKIFQESTRSEDLVARWGGEEFAIFLRGCYEQRGVLKAKFLKEKIKRFLSEEFGFLVTLSFGVKEIEKGESLEDLMRIVDSLMYESKKKGKDTVTFFSEKCQK